MSESRLWQILLTLIEVVALKKEQSASPRAKKEKSVSPTATKPTGTLLGKSYYGGPSTGKSFYAGPPNGASFHRGPPNAVTYNREPPLLSSPLLFLFLYFTLSRFHIETAKNKLKKEKKN